MQLKLMVWLLLAALGMGMGAGPVWAADKKPQAGVIEPFMVLPWGADYDDFIALVGTDGEATGYNGIICQREFMGMPAEVAYRFAYRSLKLTQIKVDYVHENVTLTEAQNIMDTATDFIKSQMPASESIRKTSSLNYINANVPEKITIVKDYILDDQTAALLFYWWWENESKLEACFYFVGRHGEDVFGQVPQYADIIAGIEADADYDMAPAAKLLADEKEPFVYLDWSLSPSKLKKLKGKPSQETGNWFFNFFLYEDVVWGVPAKTDVIFSRDYKWIGFKHMEWYGVYFTVYGLDLVQAQTITENIILSINSVMRQPFWREGATLKHDPLGIVEWRSGWQLYDDKTIALTRFIWKDYGKSYSVRIILTDIKAFGPLDEKDKAERPFKDTPLTERPFIETGKME